MDRQDRVTLLLKILFKIALFLYVHMNQQVVMKVVFQLVLISSTNSLLASIIENPGKFLQSKVEKSVIKLD